MPGCKIPMQADVPHEVRRLLDALPKAVLQDMLVEQLATACLVTTEQIRRCARPHLRAHERARKARGGRARPVHLPTDLELRTLHPR